MIFPWVFHMFGIILLQLRLSSAVKFTSKQSMSKAARAGGCIRKAQKRTWRPGGPGDPREVPTKTWKNHRKSIGKWRFCLW